MRGVAVSAVILCAAAGDFFFDPPDAIDVAPYDVVIMGEVHDNPAHHANQAAWVARMQPTAVVYEMLTPELADVGQKAGPDAPDLGAVLQWEQRGWGDFSMYAPIFSAANGAAVYGGDVSRDALGQAMRHGAGQAMGDAAKLFGLDVPLLTSEQEARETMMAESHCGALPVSALPGMVEAQRLRDAALAKAVIAALLSEGPPVAVITGNGHARNDWGIPAALHQAIDDTPLGDISVLTIGQLETVPTTAQPFDVLTVSPAPARDDPCDAFR
ncbi:ChaN family lipoprotein [Oceaniglobus ichthyenteri]|uniref:ChaN family lipoprotein n=1 Tax=Oceaniglobus ichthyenteri TaxID=2136177 RepID=UPI000D364012|nr:ChaN family lipoprotein [Oceaniglobus ichthyenteri]